MDNKITIMSEQFENEQTGDKVDGITIIIDGKIKQVMDVLISQNNDYNNYPEIVRDALFEGINVMISQSK